MLWKAETGAAYLGISAERLYYLMRSEQVQAVRVRSEWRFVPESLEDYAEKQSL